MASITATVWPAWTLSPEFDVQGDELARHGRVEAASLGFMADHSQ